jgi:nicotinate phosphoribosyltransferase
MEPSILDNDQYKFTMQQALLKLGFAAVPVEYKLHCRSEGIDFRPHFEEIKKSISLLPELQLLKIEHDYLSYLRYFHKDYLHLLKGFRFDLDYIDLKLIGKDLHLRIKGPWFNTILFEVPLLYIISEEVCYNNELDYPDGEIRLDKKLSLITSQDLDGKFRYGDFGTRRRKSASWQYRTIKKCIDATPYSFIGTSNLCLARMFNITPIGTMAHEWLQAHQQLNYRVADSQKMAFENWIKVYRGDLGIALSDVINTDAFLKDFDDPLFYKLFDGVREDSEEDPITFGHRISDFYFRRGIDSKSKTIVFSNGLNFEKAIEIYNELHGSINVSFGVGTNLTNDFEKPALNIVIKMVSCNGQPVAKISNSPGKGMCESPEFVNYLKSVYNVK